MTIFQTFDRIDFSSTAITSDKQGPNMRQWASQIVSVMLNDLIAMGKLVDGQVDGFRESWTYYHCIR